MENQTTPPQPQNQSVVIKFPVAEPYVTYAVVGLSVLIFVYMQSLSIAEQNDIYTSYGNFSDLIRSDGEYYRLFTSMFLHANLTHLAFNSLFIYLVGKDIEALFGHVRFALVYFLGGLAGSVASFIITQGNSIGASGAAFAVFGALASYYYQNRHLYGNEGTRRRLQQLGSVALINLVIGLISNVPGSPARIDNAAHIGGAIGGAALAWFICPVFRVKMQFRDGVPTPRVVDERTITQWIYVPIVFAAVLTVIAVSFAGA